MNETSVRVVCVEDENGKPALYRTIFSVGVQHFVIAEVRIEDGATVKEAQQHCEFIRSQFLVALNFLVDDTLHKNRQLRAWLRYISTGWPENPRATADQALDGQLAPKEYLEHDGV